MNKNIKLAVAGAVLAMSASAANAGIIIPAGDWTLDINGNVNAYANWTKADHADVITGGLAKSKDALGEDKTQGINTGLLPSWLGFTGTTRQNDTDVSFTISMQPNVSDNAAAGDAKTPLFRQSFLTFGDKSWGSVKLGKDIGIFASDAILNDMTLLGVGAGALNSGASTTLGGIGSGYIYAAWKGQVAYTTPNFNGFQATVGVTQAWNAHTSGNVSEADVTITGTTAANQVITATDAVASGFGGTGRGGSQSAYEGKASYSFAADALTGKVWVGGATYKAKNAYGADSVTAYYENTASVADLGANLSVGNVGVTGYYYTGEGVGTTAMFLNSHSATGQKRDSDGGYGQLTYTLPTKTKIGAAYGVSRLDMASGEASSSAFVKENKRYTLGAYHPLTKHLNLVAEWNDIESKAHNGDKNESTNVSLGAILFF